MDVARDALLFVHLLGFAALLGGGLVQLGAARRTVNGPMLYGALTQLVSGLLLVGVLEADTDGVDKAQVGVKFGVAVVIALLCWANRRRPFIPDGLYLGLLILIVANVAVAVFWMSVSPSQ
jgi:hypothetical protein